MSELYHLKEALQHMDSQMIAVLMEDGTYKFFIPTSATVNGQTIASLPNVSEFIMKFQSAIIKEKSAK